MYKINEKIIEIIEKNSIYYNSDKKNKEKFEQYFTPESIALYMSNMIKINLEDNSIRILDPGCGLGSLSISLLINILNNYPNIKKIYIKLYEIDKSMAKTVTTIFNDISEVVNDGDIDLKFDIICKDFVEDSLQGTEFNLYDVIIMNPPYGKIERNSEVDTKLISSGIDVPNIYAAFSSLAIEMLKGNGQLVAITPRSFCNGLYFTNFRKSILKKSSIVQIHVFDSRSECFKADNILQEVIIYKIIKSTQNQSIKILHSKDGKLDNIKEEIYKKENIIDPKDEHMFIKILKDSQDSQILSIIENMPCELKDINLEVSTGPIISYRVKESLSKELILGSIPIIYPEHFSEFCVKWPLLDIKKKFNFIFPNNNVVNYLRENGNYVLVKRFSAKEEKRRIVSKVWIKENADYNKIGIDNKLNYYHSNKTGIDIMIAKGLNNYLNSTMVDKWFRTISGSTQVNVTDLRKLRYPTSKQLILLADINNQNEVANIIYNISNGTYR